MYLRQFGVQAREVHLDGAVQRLEGYCAEVTDAQPALAFGSPPERETAWIGEVLRENGVALVVADQRGLRPMNELARALPPFTG